MSTTRHRPGRQVTDPAAQARIEVLAQVADHLYDLQYDIRLLERLAHGHVRGLGFASPEALELQADRARRDRAARNRRREAVQPHLRDDLTHGHGATANPGNLAAIDTLAQLHAGLVDLARRIHRDFGRRGACSIRKMPTPATLIDLTWHLAELTPDVPADEPGYRLLTHTARELSALTAAVTATLDGNDRVRLEKAHCPWCGHDSLVVTFRNGLVTCDGTHPCSCGNPSCGCARNPIHYRHTWDRARANRPGGWWSLSDHLNRDQQLREDHMIAHQLLDLIDSHHHPVDRCQPDPDAEWSVPRSVWDVEGFQDRYGDPHVFQVCAACSDLEMNDQLPDDHEVTYRDSLWPCPLHQQAHQLYDHEIADIKTRRGTRWAQLLTTRAKP